MRFRSPAQEQLDQINDQMELFSIWDNILNWTQRLHEVARVQRRICKQALRQLEQEAATVLRLYRTNNAYT
jgi:hypothetical protein